MKQYDIFDATNYNLITMTSRFNSFEIIRLFIYFFLLFNNLTSCCCATTTTTITKLNHVENNPYLSTIVSSESNVKVDSKLKQAIKPKRTLSTDDESRCQICPEDSDIDEGETTFALIGAVWAMSGFPSDIMESEIGGTRMDGDKPAW